MNPAFEMLIVMAVVAVAVIGTGVGLGMARKAVVFRNKVDFVLLGLAWVAGIAAFYLNLSLLRDDAHVGGAFLCGLIMVFFLSWVAVRTLADNKFYFFPFVLITKAVLFFFYALFVLEVFFPSGKTTWEQSRRRAGAVVKVGLMTPVMYALMDDGSLADAGPPSMWRCVGRFVLFVVFFIIGMFALVVVMDTAVENRGEREGSKVEETVTEVPRDVEEPREAKRVEPVKEPVVEAKTEAVDVVADADIPASLQGVVSAKDWEKVRRSLLFGFSRGDEVVMVQWEGEHAGTVMQSGTGELDGCRQFKVVNTKLGDSALVDVCVGGRIL